MSLRSRLAAAVGALTALAVAPIGNAATSPHRPPARMLVYAQEWSLWPSRTRLPHGPVIVQLWNRGQDAHDLRIRRLDRHGRMAGRAQDVAVTESGARTQAEWHLAPGRYELYCSMPGHVQQGMHTLLVVH